MVRMINRSLCDILKLKKVENTSSFFIPEWLQDYKVIAVLYPKGFENTVHSLVEVFQSVAKCRLVDDLEEYPAWEGKDVMAMEFESHVMLQRAYSTVKDAFIHQNDLEFFMGVISSNSPSPSIVNNNEAKKEIAQPRALRPWITFSDILDYDEEKEISSRQAFSSFGSSNDGDVEEMGTEGVSTQSKFAKLFSPHLAKENAKHLSYRALPPAQSTSVTPPFGQQGIGAHEAHYQDPSKKGIVNNSSETSAVGNHKVHYLARKDGPSVSSTSDLATSGPSSSKWSPSNNLGGSKGKGKERTKKVILWSSKDHSQSDHRLAGAGVVARRRSTLQSNNNTSTASTSSIVNILSRDNNNDLSVGHNNSRGVFREFYGIQPFVHHYNLFTSVGEGVTAALEAHEQEMITL